MIVLIMILKNEEHVLDRCLASALPWIDAAAFLVDPLTTDRTREIIRQQMANTPFVLEEKQWKGFGPTRTEAFSVARHHFRGHALFLDADLTFSTDPNFSWPALDRDIYGMWNYVTNRGRYLIPQLANLELAFKWDGIVHEELVPNRFAKSGSILDNCCILDHQDGNRSKDPLRSAKDAELLDSQPKTSRTVFYAAQCWAAAGSWEKAYSRYQMRSRMGGFEEEVWYSMLMMAVALEQLSAPSAEVVRAYLAAYRYRPSRAESLRLLSAYHLISGNTGQAQIVSQAADTLPMTTDTLFVDTGAYAPI
jgi:hypothetical protein